ncbi:hypothetical protein QTP88_028685 [Uroleucon formosanum]
MYTFMKFCRTVPSDRKLIKKEHSHWLHVSRTWILDGKNRISDVFIISSMQNKHHDKTHDRSPYNNMLFTRAREECKILDNLYKAIGLCSNKKKIEPKSVGRSVGRSVCTKFQMKNVPVDFYGSQFIIIWSPPKRVTTAATAVNSDKTVAFGIVLGIAGSRYIQRFTRDKRFVQQLFVYIYCDFLLNCYTEIIERMPKNILLIIFISTHGKKRNYCSNISVIELLTKLIYQLYVTNECTGATMILSTIFFKFLENYKYLLEICLKSIFDKTYGFMLLSKITPEYRIFTTFSKSIYRCLDYSIICFVINARP